NPAGKFLTFPIRPHAGERHLPVQEPFFGDELARPGEYLCKPCRLRPSFHDLRRSERNLHRIAKLPVEERTQHSTIGTIPKVEPFKGVNERQERIERRGHVAHFVKDIL